ncbi:hypothetical protein HMPREF1988_01198 [Porphyromonas gingivalis F0185]|nr:hypothetical protein HMPREF1988_01198 [Porphyromonas gingivalis F0185]
MVDNKTKTPVKFVEEFDGCLISLEDERGLLYLKIYAVALSFSFSGLLIRNRMMFWQVF